MDLFLPAVADKDGPIFLFGDNLSSHFCPELVHLVKEQNVFHHASCECNELAADIRCGSVWTNEEDVEEYTEEVKDGIKEGRGKPKGCFFISFAFRLHAEVRETVSDNLVSGFRGCGIWSFAMQL